MNTHIRKLVIALFWVGGFFSCHQLKAQGSTLTFPISATQTSPSALNLNFDNTTGTFYEIGPFNASATLSIPAGSEMVWIPALSAFRAGNFIPANMSMIGQYSLAFGLNSTASGNNSACFGSVCTSSGSYSTAMGIFTHAVGSFSTSMGDGTTAMGNYSTATGNNTSANAVDSFTIGSHNLGTGEGGASISATVPAPTDPLLEVGNGSTSASDALVVYRDGKVAVHTELRCAASGDLSMGIFTAGSAP